MGMATILEMARIAAIKRKIKKGKYTLKASRGGKK